MGRRSTLQITLVLIGIATLTACGEQKRSVYSSKQDCVDDWGDGKGCEEPPPGSAHYHSGYWYGPRWGRGGYRGSRSLYSVSVSRGGFGRLGGFHASFGG